MDVELAGHELAGESRERGVVGVCIALCSARCGLLWIARPYSYRCVDCTRERA